MRKLSITLLGLLLSFITAFGQVPGKATRKPGVKSGSGDKALRLSALSALESVIDELPQIEDIQDRVSIAEGVVKALAKTEPDRCRKLLDSLFDQARQTRNTAASGSKVRSPTPDAVIERIIRLAALLDVKLAESYVEKYSSHEDSNSAQDRAQSQNGVQASSLRLKMALELIDNSPASSMSIAETSLGAGIFPDTLVFLASLRNKDVRLANNFFIDALASVKGRQGGDVNELLLLYSYVFSPRRVPVVSARGIGVFSIPAYLSIAQEYPVDPLLARLYLDTTAQIVFDPNRLNQNNLASLVSGLEGDFYLISIIQPAVSNYLPQLFGPLEARKAVIAGMLQDRREAAVDAADRWDKTPNSVNLTGGGNTTTVDYLLERAEKTSDTARKDQLYYRAATTAVAAKDYDRALKIVDKLSGPYSSEARQFIRFDIALSDARNREFDKAEFFARGDDDLTSRAFVFTVIAVGLLEGKGADPGRARGFLDEVEQLASKLNKEAEKTAVLFGLVSVYARFDLGLALQSLPIAVQSANKLDGFGGDNRIPRGVFIGGFLFDNSMYGDEFTFIEAIKALGAKNFDGNLSQIRVLKSRVPRLRATVVICSAVLSGAA